MAPPLEIWECGSEVFFASVFEDVCLDVDGFASEANGAVVVGFQKDAQSVQRQLRRGEGPSVYPNLQHYSDTSLLSRSQRFLSRLSP